MQQCVQHRQQTVCNVDPRCAPCRPDGNDCNQIAASNPEQAALFTQWVTTSAPDAISRDDLVALQALVIVVPVPGRPRFCEWNAPIFIVDVAASRKLNVLPQGPSTLTAARRTDCVQPNFRDQYRTSRQLLTSISGSAGTGIRCRHSSSQIDLNVEAQAVLAQMNAHVLDVLRKCVPITQ
jgi:hypothetical protein